jgi:hypothetical protein
MTKCDRAAGVEPPAIFRPYQFIAAEGDLPANYAGDVTLKVDTPDGKPLPATRTPAETSAGWRP